jgi:3(or 17)beta-hydroxysteroid dehydrogenase
MGRVDGKVALITGGASGLGAEHARVLASEGARVAITDVADEGGRRVAGEIPGAIYLHHDVRDEQRWSEVVAEVVRAFGRLDVLVNNAGLARFATIEETSYADYKLQIDVMLDGTFLGCKAAIPVMAASGGGSIINTSSIAADKAVSFLPAYSAAKAGINALTRTVAVHCDEQGYNIRANIIVPGGIDTPMNAHVPDQLPAMGKPRDIANAVLFLASDESRWISGTSIVVDKCASIR